MEALFWRENLVIGLLAVGQAICFKIKRREKWFIYWSIITVVLFFVADKLNGNWQWEGMTLDSKATLFTEPGRLLIYAGIFLQIYLCYKVSAWKALYFLALCLPLQHMQFAAFKIMEATIKLLWTDEIPALCFVLLDIIVLAAFCFAVGVLFTKAKDIEIVREYRYITVIVIVLFLCMEFLNMYLYVTDPMVNYGTTLIVSKLMDIISNVVMLFMLYNFLGRKVLEVENSALFALSKQRSSQYAFTQELINTINIKSHDLKKQIRYIRANESQLGDFLDDIENTVVLYDAIVHTNNDTLDAILTEKSLVCQKADIPFTCIADGRNLGFMKPLDLYTLFANLMDNAIEASEKVTRGNRSVSLIVKQQGSFISIHQENFFLEQPVVEEGLFKTIKKDENYHGFGIKSMRQIVDKYNGSISFDIKESTFRINILLPF